MCRFIKIGIRVLIFFISMFAVLTTVPTAQPPLSNVFFEAVRRNFSKPASCKLAACICSMADQTIASRLLSHYGSIFAAVETVRLPGRCIFENESQVTEFQRASISRAEVMSGVTVELQQAAMTALVAAQADAAKIGLRISPLDGSIAGKRSYFDTIRIWNSRYLKALDHWTQRGKFSAEAAEAARRDIVLVQIRNVIEWEAGGLNFGTDMKGSIFSSTAPPGTSQHLSMLAFDVVEYSNRRVRAIMNTHGWFQTVAGDPSHFTYLGVSQTLLPSRGLKSLVAGGQTFWVPDLILPEPQVRPPMSSLSRP